MNEFIVDVIIGVGIVKAIVRRHSSVNRQSPPLSLVNLSYNKVYHKHNVAMFCIYYVRLLPDNIDLIYWINNDHVLLYM